MSEQTINLAKAIFDKIEEIGVDKAAALFGRTAATIRKWQGGTSMPDVGAAQIILDELLNSDVVKVPVFKDAPVQGSTRPDSSEMDPEPPKKTTATDDNPNKKLMTVEPLKLMEKSKVHSILCPINRDMSYAVVLSMLGNWKSTLPPEIQGMLSRMDFEPDTLIHRSRNILATRFLESKSEWSFWMDSDIIAPTGNPGWFKRRTNSKIPDKWLTRSALDKLTSRGKTVVSAVYGERNHVGRIIASIGISPKDEGEKKTVEEIKSHGPDEKLVQVTWAGFGCMAVHRSVFEAILAKFPDLKSTKKGEPHNFFGSIESGPQGEDVAFCKRAYAAGHPTFLDLSVWCGHVGKFAFMP
jgi:hypothetical protein